MTSISDTEVVNAPGGLVELGYAEKTSNTTITGTSVTSPTTVISAITVVCDGSPVLIECYVPYLQTTASANVSAYIVLKTDNDRSLMGIVNSETASSAAYGSGVFLKRITPSAGVHTFALESYTQSGTGILGGGTGSSNGWSPVFLRVSKIIQASQLLVTQSNAPIVTSLPSGNLVTGQEVDLYVTTPYAGYQRYKWNGSAWYVIGDSRAQGVWQSWTPAVTQGVSVATTVFQAKYIQKGKTVMGNVFISVNSGASGTGGSNVFCTLPVTATGITGPPVGSAYIYDASTNTSYVCQATLATLSSVAFVNDQGGGGSWGSGPSIGLATSDQIRFNFTYEVA